MTDEEYRTAWIEAEYIVAGWWQSSDKEDFNHPIAELEESCQKKECQLKN